VGWVLWTQGDPEGAKVPRTGFKRPSSAGLSRGQAECEAAITGSVPGGGHDVDHALPRLRRRYGVVTTGLVMGLLWGLWHFPMFAGTRDPTGTLPAALVVALYLFAWLPPYRVLMVWVDDRTESLPIAMLMHVPISVSAFVMASEATSSAALVVPVLIWSAALWVMVAVVAWANGGSLTRRQHTAG
jgi:CAAX protease family protein